MQRLSRPRYADDFRFEDPLQRQTSFQAFQSNLTFLRTVFNIKFLVHKVEAEGNSQVISKWVPLPVNCLSPAYPCSSTA